MGREGRPERTIYVALVLVLAVSEPDQPQLTVHGGHRNPVVDYDGRAYDGPVGVEGPLQVAVGGVQCVEAPV